MLNIASKSFKLNNGTSIPAVGAGFGTKWCVRHEGSPPDETVVTGVVEAIKNGFVHLDGAEFYNTEREMGLGVQKAGADRSKLFITTKVSKSFTNIAGALDTMLDKLKTDYVDLYLLHSPFFDTPSLEQAWKDMEACYKSGKARAIGVSNFRVRDIETILKTAEIPPAVNQIEFHACLQNQSPNIVKFCQDKNILVTAYSPLTPILVGENEMTQLVDKIAKAHSKTPGQVLLRWVLQKNVLPITASSKPERLAQALDIFDFELSNEEMDAITSTGNSNQHRAHWQGADFN